MLYLQTGDMKFGENRAGTMWRRRELQITDNVTCIKLKLWDEMAERQGSVDSKYCFTNLMTEMWNGEISVKSTTQTTIEVLYVVPYYWLIHIYSIYSF